MALSPTLSKRVTRKTLKTIAVTSLSLTSISTAGITSSFIGHNSLNGAVFAQEVLDKSATFKTYDAETFYANTAYSLSQDSARTFSPNGKKVLITSNASGVLNTYSLNLETGEQTQLTKSTTNPNVAVSYFGDGNRILFSADGGGDELNHLFVWDGSGEITDITPGEQVKATFIDWVDDGDAFIVESNRRDSRVFDLYRYDSKSLNSELIFKNDLALGDLTVSRDGRYVAGVKEETSSNNNIYIVDLNGNEIVPNLITSHEGNIEHRVFSFTPEGDKLVYGSDAEGEFSQAYTYTLDGGESQSLISEDWDVAFVSYSPSGKYRISGINQDASTKVTITKRRTNKLSKRLTKGKLSKLTDNVSSVTLPEGLPDGDLGQVRFSPNEKSIAFTLNASNAPSNIYTVNLKDETFKQHTQALNKDLNPDDLVVSRVQRYKSFDGLEIPGILYQPKTASAENPVPALVWVHGGPGGQSRTGYSATIQHLVNHGYAVFAANNRGSSGYGKTFFHLDDKRHGQEDLQDIVYAKNYLAEQDWVDGDKIGIIGGSYGGYMVMAALAFEPEAFALGIDIFGVTNWVRTLQSIPPWWESFRASLYDEMGDPAIDAERHRAISPLFHADNITKPVLVIQGANDPRVLQIESDEMVAAVRANGLPVEYIVFPDEGHGFRKRDNQITASNAYVGFLDKYLKKITSDHAGSHSQPDKSDQ